MTYGEDYFDLLVIGGGSAGFSAAIKGSELGGRVAIVEKDTIGGTCVNRGCVPSKFMLFVTNFFYEINENRFGLFGNKIQGFNMEEATSKKDVVVSEMRYKKYESLIPSIKAKYFRGTAIFEDENKIIVNGKRIRADNIIIATGSRPNRPIIPGIENARVLTSDEVFELKNVPESVIILGGRFVALELAQILRHAGSEVYLFQRSGRIIPNEEPEISEEMEKIMVDEGINIFTNTRIINAGISSKSFVEVEINNKLEKFYANYIILALGRVPNTENLNLKNIGVLMDENGHVKVDRTMKTSIENIYAAGDVSGKPYLVTKAGKEGSVAAENALLGNEKKIDYFSLPHAIFTNPNIASVGITEEKAKEMNINVKTRVLKMEYVPKAELIMNTKGLIKMIVDAETDVVMGVHILGYDAAEIIQAASLIVKYRMTVDSVAEMFSVYPTMSESIKLIAQSFKKDVSKLSCCAE